MKLAKIVSVPEKMQKYYGSGTMLHPDVEMVEDTVSLIPRGKVATIEDLAKKLAEDYGSDVTCPMRTGNHLKRISKRYAPEHLDFLKPFWRVIRTDGMVVKLDNFAYWATVLEKEGFELELTKSNDIKVLTTENQFFRFDL